jgi:hypothetical protein
MKISGFGFVRDADKLYYPIKESIESVLPIVDEFVMAVGDCAEGDNTRKLIESIDSPKVKILDTVWDTKTYPRGMEHAHQTDIAKDACQGDWLIYLQADELIHEKYLPIIRNACEKYVDDKRVDGFLMNYKHFYGDYKHYMNCHGWYPREIRIVRNEPDIHSYKSAQSFRRIPDFDRKDYHRSEGTHKINVIYLKDVYMYHYGWVRPPQMMQKKRFTTASNKRGIEGAKALYGDNTDYYDYGPLGGLATFNESHPAVLQEWIKKFNWANQLNYDKVRKDGGEKHKHETFKYKFLTFIEQKILGFKNKEIGYNNWNIIGKYAE